MKRIVVLNGPPRTGKDTAFEAIHAVLPAAELHKFTRFIKDCTHKSYGLDVTSDHFETVKDTALGAFSGLTPRQAYIKESARLKELYGNDIVCRKLVEAVGVSNAPVIVINDAGDDHEMDWVCRSFPDAQIMLIKLYREGHDYSSCCRSYIADRSDVQTIHLHNDDIDQFRRHVVELVSFFMEPQPPAQAFLTAG